MNVEQSGVIIGWSSPVLARLQGKDSPIPTTSDEGSWIATILALTSFFCTPFSALSIHYLGRKHTMAIAVIPVLISWIIIAFATTTTELIIARGICGIATSLTFTVSPVYLGEIAPDQWRGGIGLCISVIMNLGTLWIYYIGTLPDLWLSSLLSAFPLIIFIIFYKWLPESPYFLHERNRRDEAIVELKRLRNTDNVDDEIKKMDATAAEKTNQSAFMELIKEPAHRRALMISIGTFTFAQFTGGITFLLYAHLIFQKAGNVSANLMSMIKASLQLISSIGSAYVVDNVGKRPLLIISCIGSAFFMACEGIYFYMLDNKYDVEFLWWLPLAAMILFNISQAIGLTSISLVYLGELFHPNVKSIAVCISKAYLALSVFVVGKLFQVMTDAFGSFVPFFVFSVIGVIGVFFVVFCVPETKGRSFEEIQYYMKHKTYDRGVIENGVLAVETKL